MNNEMPKSCPLGNALVYTGIKYLLIKVRKMLFQKSFFCLPTVPVKSISLFLLQIPLTDSHINELLYL